MGHKKNNRRGAWTLIEMLVVVGILGIVAAVIFAALRGERGRSEQVVLASEAKVLNDAVTRVKLTGSQSDWLSLSNILHVDQDADAAIQWLVDRGYVRIKDFEPQPLTE